MTMTPDEAEQQARIRFLRVGTAFFRAGQAAAWAVVVFVIVVVLQRVTG
jgi:hypothetical protein